jgi:hypothetical protein
MNVHWFDDEQAHIQTAKPLLPECSVFAVEKAIENFKRYTTPGTDQVPALRTQAGRRTVCSEIHILSN